MTKTKRQLRDEAALRLRKLRNRSVYDSYDLIEALVGEDRYDRYADGWGNEASAIISLLTDDGSECKCMYCDVECPNYDMACGRCKGTTQTDENGPDSGHVREECSLLTTITEYLREYGIVRDCAEDVERVRTEYALKITDMIDRDYVLRDMCDEWIKGDGELLAREREARKRAEAERDEARALADSLRESAKKREDVTLFGVVYVPLASEDGMAESDAVSLLQECSRADHGMAMLRDRLGVSKDGGWLQRCLAAVAKMVQRDLAKMQRDCDGWQWAYETTLAMARQCAEERADATFGGVDYTPYPLDADGVSIKVGDATDDGRAVSCIRKTDAGWEVVLDDRSELRPEDVHHRPDTVEDVEDVLWQLVDELSRDDTELCDDEIIERFAAKLRLADID